MKRITLVWGKKKYKDIKPDDDTYLYALCQDSELLYIGSSYDQNVRVEIYRNAYEFELNRHQLTILLGYIDREATDYKRITPELVWDIEAHLIYHQQPELNTHHKKEYHGRKEFDIINKGNAFENKREPETKEEIPLISKKFLLCFYSVKEFEFEQTLEQMQNMVDNYPSAKMESSQKLSRNHPDFHSYDVTYRSLKFHVAYDRNREQTSIELVNSSNNLSQSEIDFKNEFTAFAL